jgi:hypothetical protein
LVGGEFVEVERVEPLVELAAARVVVVVVVVVVAGGCF